MSGHDTAGDEPVDVRIPVRNQLVHAYVQLVANSVGVDLLHLKGSAVHPSIHASERQSLDVDVLVRPAHVDRFIGALQDLGWQRMTGFTEGSAFGHAMNLRHDLGLIDLHRRWPGFEISPEDAFDLLWDRRETAQIANVACVVPSVADQRLILLLHFARSGGARADDKEATWTGASREERQRVRDLAGQFDAGLALAAATGELEDFKDERSYRLWRYFSRGHGSRIEEWTGRYQAATGLREKSAVLRGFMAVNHDLLAFELGHEPNRADYLQAYAHRLATAASDVRHVIGARTRRPR